jgi:RNase H-fold protein (predicted Holliday junction resolvase)
LILALDPGKAKIGWAIVDEEGRARGQGIVSAAGWEQQLQKAADISAIRIVVVGDGTERLNIERAAQRLIAGAEIAVVDERGSTVDGWVLKRRETARNPISGLWFMLVQLFNPAPVDDYAARVLAMRYLKDRGL